MSYIFEGRLNPRNNWTEIKRGDLPWKNATSFPRNTVPGRTILSTHERGDDSLSYTEVTFYQYDFSHCGPPPLQKEYRGTMNSTISGRVCQRWSAQSPHTHSRTEGNYPGAGLGNHNYCRNPDGQSGGAWCYTTDAKVRWEYCDVSDCKDDPTTLNGYLEYKITWTATRGTVGRPGRRLAKPAVTTTTSSIIPSQLSLQIAEIEVPGLIGEEYPMPSVEYDGEYLPSIISLTDGFSISVVGGFSDGFSDQMAFDGSTAKFSMYRYSSSISTTAAGTDARALVAGKETLTLKPSQRPTPLPTTRKPSNAPTISRPGLIVTPPTRKPPRGPTPLPTPLPTTSMPTTMQPSTAPTIPLPGLIVTPTHGRKSVVTGLRLYMSNSDPGSDPVQYQIYGRALSNSNIMNIRDNRCWAISDDFWLVANSPCSTSDIRQKIYMNTLGEIRVLSHPGFCLNALYGYFFKRNRFTLCYSNESEEYAQKAQVQQFSFDSKTGQITNYNDYTGTTCSRYDRGSGYISQRKCSGSGTDTKFVIGMSNPEEWTLISAGSFPWISEYQRNPNSVQMLSTYDKGDKSKYFSEVRLYSSTTPYDEYMILFPETRDPDATMIEFAELELPGMLLG